MGELIDIFEAQQREFESDRVNATEFEIDLGFLLQEAAGVEYDDTDYHPLPVYLRQARELTANKKLKESLALRLK